MRDTGHEDVLKNGVALLAVDEAGELAEERQRQIDVVHAAGLVQREVQFLARYENEQNKGEKQSREWWWSSGGAHLGVSADLLR